MVKVGFIVEGETERIILEKSDFFNHLQKLNIAYVEDVVDAKGNGKSSSKEFGCTCETVTRQRSQPDSDSYRLG